MMELKERFDGLTIPIIHGHGLVISDSEDQHDLATVQQMEDANKLFIVDTDNRILEVLYNDIMNRRLVSGYNKLRAEVVYLM
jgi:hypothetical protein